MLDTITTTWSHLFDFVAAIPGAITDHPTAFAIIGAYAATVIIATAAVTRRAGRNR
jgi:hypothetical protein